MAACYLLCEVGKAFPEEREVEEPKCHAAANNVHHVHSVKRRKNIGVKLLLSPLLIGRATLTAGMERATFSVEDTTKPRANIRQRGNRSRR